MSEDMMMQAEAAAPKKEPTLPRPMERWVELGIQHKYGSSVYVCQSCGRKALKPEETCPPVPHPNPPCSAWPMSMPEYQALMTKTTGKKCVFIGHVITGNGEVIQVGVPISEELAKELAVVDAELKMLGDKHIQQELEGIDFSEVEKKMSGSLTPEQMHNLMEMITRHRAMEGLAGPAPGLHPGMLKEMYGSPTPMQLAQQYAEKMTQEQQPAQRVRKRLLEATEEVTKEQAPGLAPLVKQAMKNE